MRRAVSAQFRDIADSRGWQIAVRLAAARQEAARGWHFRLVAGFDLLETRARRSGKGSIGIGIEIGLEIGRAVAALDRVPEALFDRIGGANRFAR